TTDRPAMAPEAHTRDALVRVDPPRPAVLLFQLARLDRALPRADPADPAHALLAAEHLLLDQQLFLAGFVVGDEPRRPVAEFRVHIFGPQIERLQDVPIGVDDVVGAAHLGSSAM